MEKLEKNFREIIIINLLLAGMMIQAETVYAMDSYHRELLPGSIASFKHWNLERSEVTGYSHYRYVELIKDGTRFIIEKNENTKPDGMYLHERHSGLNRIQVFQNGMRKKICVKIFGLSIPIPEK
ncbi:MAG: hypothetical protein CM1200mP28_05410 [Deltaproteobacteria bacterium]|nr:MAG: hypothetical protein CM1200mP28_05410 [Deltaproteobacteria bacterium]